MGDDFCRMGSSQSQNAGKFLRYHHEQGLSKRLLKPDKLFASETLESFKI